MHLGICTGSHAREGEQHFAEWLKLLEQDFGIGYFGGFGKGLEVEYVTCLSHCQEGYSVAAEGDVMVLNNSRDFQHPLSRIERIVRV